MSYGHLFGRERWTFPAHLRFAPMFGVTEKSVSIGHLRLHLSVVRSTDAVEVAVVETGGYGSVAKEIDYCRIVS